MSSSQQRSPSKPIVDPHVASTKCSCGEPIVQRVSHTKNNPDRSAWADQFRLSAPGFKAADSESSFSSPNKNMTSTTKRKRSSSPQEVEAPRASTSKKRTDYWARKAEFDEPDSDDWPDPELEKQMDISPNKSVEFSPARRDAPQTPNQTRSFGSNTRNAEPRSMIQDDPDNPFVVTATTKRANGATSALDNVHKTPGGSLVPRSRVGDVFDEVLEVQVKLKAAIETAERKAVADSRARDWKVQRIKTLEAEIEDLRKQNEALKRENEELRRRRY